MPTYHNLRSRAQFLPSANGTVRPLTPDEARQVAAMVIHLSINTRAAEQVFLLRDILHLVLTMADSPADPALFVRPVYELMQRFVLLGAVLDVTPHDLLDKDLLARRYRSGVQFSNEEWATQQLAADALGLPYVAHQAAPLSVRVLAPRPDGDPGMGSGVVLANGLIVTNRHVIENAHSPEQISVSWGDSPVVPCTAFKVHDDEAIDLAVIAVPGFLAQPYAFLRDPVPAEEVALLAYPFVPQVPGARPQLVFTGTVATSVPIATYWGAEQCIVNAVMPPGASGGPIFGKDGRLVGLVVNMLAGQTLHDNTVLTSTLHAFLPAGLLMRELPKLHPQFAFLNRFASAEEVQEAFSTHADKWWQESTV